MAQTADCIKREIKVWRLVLQDPQVPRPAKWLLGLAIGYAVSPIDLIPDFIPILGHLDDLIIVPAVLFMAIRFVPKEILVEYRGQIDQESHA